jgi:glycosyltransferase involved in cell wall biosynthesis
MEPFVSVVIPTRNRAASLVKTLEGIDTKSGHIEIVVANNGSTDDTSSVVKRADAKDVWVERPSAAAARNAGVAHACAPNLTFLDDDIRVTTDAVLRCAQLAHDEHAWVVATLRWPAEVERTPLQRWREARADWHPTADTEEIDWFQSGFASTPRELFEDIGGYDERFPAAGLEDIDLAIRARRRGHRILLTSLVTAVHDDHAGGDIRATWRRARSSARTAVTMATLHPDHGAAVMVERNAPVAPGDRPRTILSKAARRALGTAPVAAGLVGTIALAERVTSSRRVLGPMYHVALVGATNRGIRDGLEER